MAIASHHAERCCGVVNLCVPYFARGFALPNLLPLVDRDLYPSNRYQAGPWDYWLYYREHFAQASQAFEADVAATLSRLYRTAPACKAGVQAFTANIRAQGGWFGGAGKAVASPRDEALLDESDFDCLVKAFCETGFRGANAWYMNDAENIAYAAEAPDFGRIKLPAPTSVPGLYAAGDAATRELICGGFTGGGGHNAAWAMSSGTWAGQGAADYARQFGTIARRRCHLQEVSHFETGRCARSSRQPWRRRFRTRSFRMS
jgi:hypothetical protein